MPNLFFRSSKPRFVDNKKIIREFKKLGGDLAKKNTNIESIYLFGSYAQGNAGLRSDADIMVILKQDKRKMLDRLDEFILEFSDGPVPVDVLVYTQAELSQALKEKNHFFTEAVKGIKLTH